MEPNHWITGDGMIMEDRPDPDDGDRLHDELTRLCKEVVNLLRATPSVLTPSPPIGPLFTSVRYVDGQTSGVTYCDFGVLIEVSENLDISQAIRVFHGIVFEHAKDLSVDPTSVELDESNSLVFFKFELTESKVGLRLVRDDDFCVFTQGRVNRSEI